jgi:hypothetical protein
VGIGIFGDFSFGIIFQQVSLRMVTHCAGGFFGVRGGEMVGRWGFGGFVYFLVQSIVLYDNLFALSLATNDNNI